MKGVTAKYTQVLDEVAERAGFQYINTYTFLPEPPDYPRKTWDEYLGWAVSTYDLVADRFLRTPTRQVCCKVG